MEVVSFQLMVFFVVVVSAFTMAFRSRSKIGKYFSAGASVCFAVALCIAATYYPNNISGLPLTILGVALVAGLSLLVVLAIRIILVDSL